MKSLRAHSTTSMAVKAVITEVKKRLETKFDFLEGFPTFFYDFNNNNVTDQFKQYYARIPSNKRRDPWIVLSYTYQSTERSDVQPRNGFSFNRRLSNSLTRTIDFQYVQLPLLISVLTNDSKCLNELANFITIKLNWSFSCKYQDLLWPLWVKDALYPIGWYIRPSKPNGKIYVCSKSGISGSIEPLWSDNVGDIIEDNEAAWTCLDVDLLTVKAGSFVKNDTTVNNPIEDGIMYQYDFGYSLHYTDYDDAGEIVGYITEADMKLLNMNGSIIDTIHVE